MKNAINYVCWIYITCVCICGACVWYNTAICNNKISLLKNFLRRRNLFMQKRESVK